MSCSPSLVPSSFSVRASACGKNSSSQMARSTLVNPPLLPSLGCLIYMAGDTRHLKAGTRMTVNSMRANAMAGGPLRGRLAIGMKAVGKRVSSTATAFTDSMTGRMLYGTTMACVRLAHPCREFPSLLPTRRILG